MYLFTSDAWNNFPKTTKIMLKSLAKRGMLNPTNKLDEVAIQINLFKPRAETTLFVSTYYLNQCLPLQSLAQI